MYRYARIINVMAMHAVCGMIVLIDRLYHFHLCATSTKHPTKFYSHRKKTVSVGGAKPAPCEAGGSWSRGELQFLTNTGW